MEGVNAELLDCLKKVLYNTKHGAGLQTRYDLEDRIEAAIAKAEGVTK